MPFLVEMGTQESFNPHTQDITLFYPDGSNFTMSIAEMDIQNAASIKLCVVMASQIGACAILFFLLVALTKPEKRCSPIFLVNSLSLILVVIRSILQILYFTGPWYGVFSYYGLYFDDIPTSSWATSVATSVMALLLHICIEISLVLQVRVVYASNPRVKSIMTVISTIVALTSVGFFTTVVVQIVKVTLVDEAPYYSKWVYPTSRAVLAFSICFFSAVFVVKLGMAIHQRRILGLEKWGPLYIIFIMGVQTLFVPAIFSILENINAVNFDGMASLTACLVAISLPVSSMWAAASVDSPVGSYHKSFSGQSSQTSGASHLIKTAKHIDTASPNPTQRNNFCYSDQDDPEKGGAGQRLVVNMGRSFDVDVSSSTGRKQSGSSR